MLYVWECFSEPRHCKAVFFHIFRLYLHCMAFTLIINKMFTFYIFLSNRNLYKKNRNYSSCINWFKIYKEIWYKLYFIPCDVIFKFIGMKIALNVSFLCNMKSFSLIKFFVLWYFVEGLKGIIYWKVFFFNLRFVNIYHDFN